MKFEDYYIVFLSIFILLLAFSFGSFLWQNPYVSRSVEGDSYQVDYSSHFSCKDSDGGINLIASGTADGTDFYGSPTWLDDYCFDQFTIVEVYCNEYNPWAGKSTGAYFVDSVKTACPRNGRCVRGVCEYDLYSPGNGCIDSDEGETLETKGSVVVLKNHQVAFEAVDECASESVIWEYSCTSNGVYSVSNSRLIACGEGRICQNGGCVRDSNGYEPQSFVEKILSIF